MKIKIISVFVFTRVNLWTCGARFLMATVYFATVKKKKKKIVFFSMHIDSKNNLSVMVRESSFHYQLHVIRKVETTCGDTM